MSPPVVFLRKQPGKFHTRIEGYGTSNKVWTCLRCRAWHDAPKPKRCERCTDTNFLHYDSAGEARWFVGLMRELDNAAIANLKHHPRYPITINGIVVFDYVADADYERAGELITGDFKPKAAQGLDPVFKLKQKCFQAQYGRLITVVTER